MNKDATNLLFGGSTTARDACLWPASATATATSSDGLCTTCGWLRHPGHLVSTLGAQSSRYAARWTTHVQSSTVLARATHSFTRADERRAFSDLPPPPPPPPISSEARRQAAWILEFLASCDLLGVWSLALCLYDYWPLTKNNVRESGPESRDVPASPWELRRQPAAGRRRVSSSCPCGRPAWLICTHGALSV